ncbi:type VI secretion system accessory protein TagJ [Acidisoma silvae]|uniref:SciE type virulence protein n=1 Tax=Acidisoma silvae TaxID=2802396 RepID=A0A963YTY9_9PROT|nr:type VI secretion system accessory protein TagJ [Acidisoma silvae]MCB8876981.1 SciE type virulence protein [Acidisoma silvae]
MNEVKVTGHTITAEGNQDHPVSPIVSLFRAGHLQAAIDAASAATHEAPADTGRQLLLAELLLFAQAFEQADATLAAMESLDISLAPGIAPFRQLLRAETSRQQTWREARLPEFLGDPTASLHLSFKALVTSLSDDTLAAAGIAREAEAARPAVPGRHGDIPFADIRDTDDICAGFLEVLTVTGRYFWLPFERIEEAVFYKAERLRDLFWQRCSISIANGPEGDVYVPALYMPPAADQHSDGLLSAGRKTDWVGHDLVRGQGQRVLLIGDEGVALQDLGTLIFA